MSTRVGDFTEIWEAARAAWPELAAERVKLNRRNRGRCPIHGGEHDNFAVLTAGFRCHVCGAAGDPVDFVRLLDFPNLAEREGRVAALRALGARFGIMARDDGLQVPPRERRETVILRAYRELAHEGYVAQRPAAVYEAVGASFSSVETPDDWHALRTLLNESFLPEELEHAGLWRGGATALPPPRPSRIRVRRDAAGVATGLQFIALAGAPA
ncbi:MAG: hypothetical protein WKG32_08320 [Gemmatimonadaceae bacterium]